MLIAVALESHHYMTKYNSIGIDISRIITQTTAKRHSDQRVGGIFRWSVVIASVSLTVTSWSHPTHRITHTD